MQTIRTMLAALLLMAAPYLMAQENGRVTVRLVLADNSGNAVQSEGLSDVLPLLKENLRFTTYRLLARKTTDLREGATVALADGYRLAFTQVQRGSCTVVVTQADKQILETRLHLRPDSPVLLGGLPGAGDSRRIIVIQSP